MEENDYIAERLDKQQQWYSQKSRDAQGWYKRLQIVQIISAACIPLLASYITDETSELKIVIGVLGIIIALITGLQSLYKFEEKWIKYRTTAESLKHEKYKFLTRTLPFDGEEPFTLLVQRVESLISKENSEWSQYMGTQSDQKHTKVNHKSGQK